MQRLSLLETISKSHSLDLFTYESIKILIDHSWETLGYSFFKLQLFCFLTFFLLPFWVDIYNLDFVLNNQDMAVSHFMFAILALITQFIFFFSEVIQMKVKGISVRDYFSEVWNWNDILCLPVYFTLQVSIWAAVTKTKKGAEGIFSIQFEMYLKIMYMVVCAQTFIKILFLIRIYPDVGFMIKIFQQMLKDLKPFFLFFTLTNILLACFFVILNPDIG